MATKAQTRDKAQSLGLKNISYSGIERKFYAEGVEDVMHKLLLKSAEMEAKIAQLEKEAEKLNTLQKAESEQTLEAYLLATVKVEEAKAEFEKIQLDAVWIDAVFR